MSLTESAILLEAGVELPKEEAIPENEIYELEE